MASVQPLLPIFIGYDPRERAATNVLIDSLYQHSSVPLSITPLVTSQLETQGHINASAIQTEHSIFVYTLSCSSSHGLSGLALFMDCDALPR